MVVPASSGTPRAPSNAELAAVFDEIGDLLEIRGELVFKTVAYHRAAEAIARSADPVAESYRTGRPPAIPGVGRAISDKIAELAATGRLAFLERLRGDVPPTLRDLLAIQGVGPRTVRLLWERAGIESLGDLRTALDTGALAAVPGISTRSIAGIAAGLESLGRRSGRMTLGQVDGIVRALVAQLEGVPGLRSLVPAGSFRRRCETIGDLDLVAETDAADRLIERFTSLPAVASIVSAGTRKASIRLARGPQADLMIAPPGATGTYLVHFTGSKEHNVRLRAIARDRGWSLSEKGFARLGDDGEIARGPGAELRTFATEADVYGFLGLDEIPPELREDRGEVEAARTGGLPGLVEMADLRGDCHAHSDWSDGNDAIEVMAEAARARGYEYLVLTDHSHGLPVANGLSPERVAAQRLVIAELNERFAREEEAGTAPPATPPGGFRLLHGCELEIRADGTLDFDDDVLAGFDVVIASLHIGRRQPRPQLTARVLGAIRSPHVDVIAHPAGRMLGERGRDDLDLDWEPIYAAAASTGTFLEIDGSDHRLDLSAERARAAVDAGCFLLVDSDAHRTEELDAIAWGMSQARRAWLTPESVGNTWSRDRLLAWVASSAARVA